MEQTLKRYLLQIHQFGDRGAEETWTDLRFTSKETAAIAMREIDKAIAGDKKAAFITDDDGIITCIPGRTIHRAFAVPEGIELDLGRAKIAKPEPKPGDHSP